MRIVLAVSMVLVLLSGCVDEGPTPGSAKYGIDVATNTARLWSEEAYLVAALLSEKDELNDTRRGDGVAPAWGYLFEAPDREGHLSVVVNDKGQTVLARPFNVSASVNPLLRPTGGGAAIGPWSIDSTDVARALADSFPRYYEEAQGDDMEMVMVLWRGEEGPAYWTAELRQVGRVKDLIVDGLMDASSGAWSHLRADPTLAEG